MTNILKNHCNSENKTTFFLFNIPFLIHLSPVDKKTPMVPLTHPFTSTIGAQLRP